MASTVWKGHLTFGLVSLPVRLYSAARGETISFNQLHKTDGSRVKQVLYCQAEERPIARDEIIKGYEYEKGKYVVVEEAEIKGAAPETATAMEILEFVRVDEVDPIYLESSYYLAPDESGEKPYALLFEALRRSGSAAIAKVAMHNREHIVILRPGVRGILLHTMYYADEIRKVDEFRTDLALVKDKELELAMMLIQSLAAPFEPEKYHDTYRQNLQALIESKLKGQQVVQSPSPRHLAPVVDIVEALKETLAKMKKPVQSVGRAAMVEESAPASNGDSHPRAKRSRKASVAGQ